MVAAASSHVGPVCFRLTLPGKSAAENLTKAIDLGVPQILGVLHFVIVREVRDHKRIFAGQFVHANAKFEKGVLAFVFGFKPSELDKFIFFLADHSC